MIDIQKMIVFLFTATLLFYMVRLLFFTRKNWKFRTYTFGVLIGGLCLITIATFFDMISFMKGFQFVGAFIRVCFTLGAIIYVIGVILWSDYTKKMIGKFEQSALTDAMTGALNRKGIEAIYEMVVEEGKSFYVMVCDLDGTKRINDSVGHLEGDKYINAATKIITESIGLKGYIARIGGDEFVILLEYMDVQELQKLILKIKQLVCEVLPKQNTGASFGHAVFPQDGITFEELIGFADIKMYEDKKSRKQGKNCL